MAILLWSVFLQIIFMLTEAQIQYYNTAQAPTSWTNNNLSMPSISGSNRIILLNKIGFACGFYSDSADNYYFAVGLARTWKDRSLGEGNWYLDHVTWSANRAKPVGVDATLQLTSDGNLILRDEDGVLVWSTNTSNMSVAGMKMMKTGNLVLYNHLNKTVWQSFDYPTDTLLPGQKLVAGQNLVASISRTNRSEGRFVLSLTSQGLFAFYQADDAPHLYFKRVISMLSSIQLYNETDGKLSLYGWSGSWNHYRLDLLGRLASNGYIVGAVRVRYSLTSYVKFDSDGHLRVYDDHIDQPVDLLGVDTCYYPTSCGNYELCTNGNCTCLPGFARDHSVDGWGRHRCKEMNPTTCENPHPQTFLVMEDVHYFTSINPEAATLKHTDAEGCKEACLKKCSCKAAIFRVPYPSSLGTCYFPSPAVSFIDGKERSNSPFKSYVFIKVGSDPNRGQKHTGLVIGSSIGALLLGCLICGFLIVILRRKIEGGDSGMEEDLYQLPGSSLRFTYEELKSATNGFQKRLGKGGFGSVYEGTLPNGEGIAVKCLESPGQGKKEFLAEVRTVGSIHHVHLARLIGFCAQKQHRLLVYELMQNGSMDSWIFHKNPLQPLLDWRTRRQLILDISRGLAYLHQDCRQTIFHLDIKPQNILLDDNLRAKISDFGLSKLIDKDQSQVMTTMRGTPGYLAPELLNSVITEKADVYSFGIVIMEVLCGRRNLDKSQPEDFMHLLPIFMRKAEESRLTDMVDEFSEDMQLHRSEVAEIMKAAVWCLQSDYTRRPTMQTLVSVLEGKMAVGADLDFSIHIPPKPAARISEADPGETAPLLPSILSGPR